jgi:hypothetical protein
MPVQFSPTQKGAPVTHIGIELKIDTPWGPLLISDSDNLYWIGQFGERCSPQPYDPFLPVQENRWVELFPGDGQAFNGSRDLIIKIRSVLLSDVDDLEDGHDPNDGYAFSIGGPMLRKLSPRIRDRWPFRTGRNRRRGGDVRE